MSEWFDITQWLWQGCVLSPLSFNVFFADGMHVLLVPLSDDPDALGHVAHLNDDRAKRIAELLHRVRRAVSGMLYADDSDMVSKSE